MVGKIVVIIQNGWNDGRIEQSAATHKQPVNRLVGMPDRACLSIAVVVVGDMYLGAPFSGLTVLMSKSKVATTLPEVEGC